MKRLMIALMMCSLSAAQVDAQYTQGTVFAVRVGVTTSSVNVGGANVVTGVNIAPFQFTAGSWQAGAALSASPTGTAALTMSSTATSEGALSITGNYLALAGYRTGTNSSGTDRIIARVDLTTGSFGAAPTIDTTTAIPNSEGYTGNNIRGAVWNSAGTQYWASGSGTGGGTRSNTFGSTTGSTQVSASLANSRVVNIFNNQLYISSQSGTFLGISTVGTGTPTNSGNTTTLLINAAASNGSYGFAFSPDNLTCYVADDRTSALGGIQKWTRPDTASAFTLATTFGTGVTNIGARGLSVDFSGTNPVIYASSAEASNNRIITFSDVAGVQTGLATIASSGTTDIFRGVAYTPGVVPEPALMGVVGLAAVALLRRRK